MWSDILTGYGIFILEILTILLVIAAIVAMIISAKQRNATHHGELVVTDLSEEFKETIKHLRDFQLSEEELKQAEKAQKKVKKQEAKALKSFAVPLLLTAHMRRHLSRLRQALHGNGCVRLCLENVQQATPG